MHEIAANKLQKCRSLVIVCIYFLFGLHAVRRAMFEDMRPGDFAVILAFQVVVTTFCIVDSKCRGKPLLHSFYWIIFFSWPLSVPIYWVWTRGLKGIVWGVLFAISLVVVSAVAIAVTDFLVGGESWSQWGEPPPTRLQTACHRLSCRAKSRHLAYDSETTP